jgi:hypothetical protein
METTAQIEAQITETRRMQYVASQTRDAGAVMRLEDTLLRLYSALDSRK